MRGTGRARASRSTCRPTRPSLPRSATSFPKGPDFTVDTASVDDEIARIAGPQLVVPVTNARYALNAANARWGSLYDALYGTDALPEDGGATRGGSYNPVRGSKVFAWTKRFLDEIAPLAKGSHTQVKGYAVHDGRLVVSFDSIEETWLDDPAKLVGLANPAQFVGYRGNPSEPRGILLAHNGLHAEIQIDNRHYIGKADIAGVADVVLESAITTIVDLEDSIAAVDPDDKVAAYRNWLGLMRGTLTDTFQKAGKEMTRRLNPDRVYTTPDGGGELTLHGRSLLLVRNVGHLMMDTSIIDRDDQPVPEGILDCVVTSLIAMHDHQGQYRCRGTAAPARSISSNPRCMGPRKSPSPTSCSTAPRTRSALPAIRSRSASWTRSGAPRSI